MSPRSQSNPGGSPLQFNQGGGDAEGEQKKTYGCSFGGASFSVSVSSGKAERVTLDGFRTDFGPVSINSLAGLLEQGDKGPKGRVSGTATIGGSADCRVTGRFYGDKLIMSASFSGAAALWDGLELTSAKLRLAGGVSGTASAKFAIPGVSGKFKLGVSDAGFTGSMTKGVKLPWLGTVDFDASVSGETFSLVAAGKQIPGAKLAHGLLDIVSGRIELKDGDLAGAVQASFADAKKILDGGVTLTVAGASVVTGKGTATVQLPDSVGGAAAEVHFGEDGVASATARSVPINTADGALQGAVDVAWDNQAGLEVSSAGLSVQTPWGSTAELSDLVLSGDRIEGKAAVPLDGIDGMTFGGDSTIELALKAGRLSGSVGPLTWTSTVNPALSGDVTLDFDSGEGLTGRASGAVQHAGGQTSLEFAEVAYGKAAGLSGIATLQTEDLGIDWTGAPFVRSLDGHATVALERGGLVSGGAVATATCDFGVVTIAVNDIGSAGPSADLAAMIDNLGTNVQLAAPVVVQGTYAAGVTTFQAEGVSFAVVTSGDAMTLNGTLGKTEFDGAGLLTSLDLELFAGPLGVAMAKGEVKDSRLVRAEFSFPHPVFRYPVTNPVIDGKFSSANLSYDQGVFSGGVAGSATLAMKGADAEDGALSFSAEANSNDGIDLLVEGSNIQTSLLTVDSFFLQVKDGEISSDIQASGSPDLPFEATGSVTGSFGEAGLVLGGALDLQSKAGEMPDLDGHVDLGYSSEHGLWANGQGSAVIDKDRNFAVEAAIAYGDGSLWVSANARGMWEAKKPLVDFNLVMGPKIKGLTGEVTFPVSGIPYVHGMTASLKTKAGLNLGTEISGVAVDAGLPAWDVLGDKPPKVDVGVQWRGRPVEIGIGLQMAGRILGHFVAGTVGVEVGGKATFDLATKNPSFRAVGSWSDEGDIIGDLFVTLPMVLQMSPQAWFKVVAGVSKWVAGVPGGKEVWKPEPITLKDLDPLDFEWRLEDLLKDESKESEAGLYGLGDLTQAQGLDKRRDPLIKGMIDHNPKLKVVVDRILGAMDVFDYSLEEGEVFYEWSSEFEARIAAGESLEGAQAQSNFLEKILREQRSISRDIPRLGENIRAKAEQAGKGGDLEGLRKAVHEMYVALNNFTINCNTLEGHFGQPIDKVFEAQIKASKSQVLAHLRTLTDTISKGGGS